MSSIEARVAGDPEIEVEEIKAVERRIRAYIRRTPVIELNAQDFRLGDFRLILKMESLQYAGSFKTRGAFANFCLRDIPSAGIAAASGGNHGAAVAYAAMTLRVPARIFVPRISSHAKIQRIRDCGADLVITGDCYAEALAASEDWVRESGALPIHAFDQRETLLGQGTLALEFQEQAPTLTSILASVGGGGLIGGIAAWYQHRINVIGVEPEGSPTLTKALEAGAPIDAEASGIAADSLAPRRIGEQVFPIASRYVSSVYLVTDDDIRSAQRALWENLRIVAEPGGAAAFAALLSGKYRPAAGEQVGVVISGGNTVAVNFDLQEKRWNA
ncbi:MAG TPA: threonine/serine dehydratase [Terracidiphilus sp.]|jgi:threonine dehydratase